MENNNDWRERFNDLLQTCQAEFKKTTKIGMKMLSASQSNTQLHETYEALGMWLKDAVEKEKLKVEDKEVLALISKISELEEAMESFEREVQEIKKEI
ncbi:MAG: hypothetical protein CME65_14535 [Halobacteriovoraceae bacterium]|nr:hypothetical protein [Halobacteriovoraceae bacterium]|tara:strand:- start:78 stop:371 length:294 start_codon:yes stop_codon:yes gene_type:complete